MWVDENGIEHIDYDNPIIETSAGREQALAQHQRDEKHYVQTDERGHSVHIADRYDIDNQGGIFDRRTGKTITTDQSSQFMSDASNKTRPFTKKQLDAVVNHIGNAEEFSELYNWSKKNSSPQFRELFSSAAQSGNTDHFIALYQDLREHYKENN